MLSIASSVEAVLFASGEPFEKKPLAALLGVSADELKAALLELGSSLVGRGVALVETADEVELRTSPEASALVKKLRESELSRDLGKASLETLAVVAYQADATRGDIDWVRGVNSSTSVRNLLLRGLIEGREDASDKRRIRYSITTEALAHLGVRRADELPRFAELAPAAKEVVRESAAS
jgi:segregation and condensation protein B